MQENEITTPIEASEEAFAVLSEDAGSPKDTDQPTAETKIDWEKRCHAAEAALGDAAEFALLFASEGGEALSLQDNAVYRRFCDLRALGLSVKEAFYAADSARESVKAVAAPTSGKEHLLFAPQKRKSDTVFLSHEEISLAKDLLGDGYSADELLTLYRRVAK